MKKTLTTAALLLLATTVYATTTPPANTGVMVQMRGNIQQNRDVRNTIRIEKKEAIGSIRTNLKGQVKLMGSTTASTSPMGLIRPQIKELRKTAKKDVALVQKNALVLRLNLAIDNLTKAKTNISTFIDKRVVAGESVGNAKELLATFTVKLDAAKKAVAAVVAWKPDAKATATTEISLTKPREIANTAIKAVNEARVAFQAIVIELRAQVKITTNNQ